MVFWNSVTTRCWDRVSSFGRKWKGPSCFVNSRNKKPIWVSNHICFEIPIPLLTPNFGMLQFKSPLKANNKLIPEDELSMCWGYQTTCSNVQRTKCLLGLDHSLRSELLQKGNHSKSSMQPKNWGHCMWGRTLQVVARLQANDHPK